MRKPAAPMPAREEHWPDELLEGQYVTEGDKLKLRYKRFGDRWTSFGGLSGPAPGTHLHETGSRRTLCGLDRSDRAPTVNAALAVDDACPDCLGLRGRPRA